MADMKSVIENVEYLESVKVEGDETEEPKVNYTQNE
jgi:hypothetical protein